jgi:uncharacterized membrane protein YkoI
LGLWGRQTVFGRPAIPFCQDMFNSSSHPLCDKAVMTDYTSSSRLLGLAVLVSALASASWVTPAVADSRLEKLLGFAARAQDRDPGHVTVPVTMAERQLTLREVAQIIAREVPGSILEAELTSQGGRPVYVVRWEPSDESQRGRLLVFVVDAENGRILSRRGG